ncbi:MAG: GNAT family N-acetyltransferase [Pseudomonadales bacterium]
MAGYDGHRGSVFYLAVLAEYQNSGFGRLLMGEIETLLKAMGWPKLNIAVRNTSKRVLDFYQSLGYSLAEVASLGKRLVPDD